MDPAADRRRGLLVGASVIGGAAVAAWVTAAILMRNRGFDITDEGYYLLSYRWWGTNLRAATGAQYVYGPVFALVHHDIAALRVVRVLSVLVANGFFGWAFMRWLRLRRPDAPTTRWWETAGTLCVVATGGVIFAWLPLSPGYNDATALGSLLLTGLVLLLARDAELGVPARWWVPTAFGFVSVALVLVKWSAVITVLALVAVILVLARSQGGRAVGRLVALLVAGQVLALAFIEVIVVRLEDALPPMLDVNRLSSQGDHQLGEILRTYLDSGRELVTHTLTGHAPLFAVAVVLVLLPWQRMTAFQRQVATVAAVLAFANSVRFVLADGGQHGGPGSLPVFSSALLAMAAGAAITSLGPGLRAGTWALAARAARVEALVGLMLLAVPFLQAAGTNVALTSMALNAFGCWTALLLLWLSAPAATTRPTAAPVRALAIASLCGLTVLCTVIAADGVLNHPYRAAPYAEDTTVVPGRTPLGSVRVPASTAREYAALRDAVAGRVGASTPPVLALDKMPGLILLLGARPVGEAWTGPTATLRSAAGLVDECRDGTLRRPPILLYNRAPARRDIDALRTCGFSLERDYRVLRVPDGPPGVSVYVPR